MSHYKSNVRDLEFNLFELFRVQRVFGAQRFGDLDTDTAAEMLSEASRMAEGPVADYFVDGDRNPPVFDPKIARDNGASGFQVQNYGSIPPGAA
jgi:hypothetical protein